MSTKTPNLRLNLIDFDQQPWDRDANENTSMLDSILNQYFGIVGLMGVWKNSTYYAANQQAIDAVDGSMWSCLNPHTSAASPTLFSADRTANPSYWVQTAPPGATAAQYAAQAAVSAAQAAASAAQQGRNTGRNLLHNSMFNVQQRGVGPFNAGATNAVYTADRWLAASALAADVASVSIVSFGDPGRAAIGDESAQWAVSCTFTGGGAGSVIGINQRIENVRRLAGKTVTLSFWANASVPLNLGAALSQYFGTGGSPSATVTVPMQAVALSTTYTRYVLTFAIPSVAGKTFGTNVGTDFTTLTLWYSVQGNAAVGNQSGAINIWGVQLEIGSVATLFEKLELGDDLQHCQRFYKPVYVAGFASMTAGQTMLVATSYATMRAVPTVVISSQTGTNNLGTLSASTTLPYSVQVSGVAVATGQTNLLAQLILAADL